MSKIIKNLIFLLIIFSFIGTAYFLFSKKIAQEQKKLAEEAKTIKEENLKSDKENYKGMRKIEIAGKPKLEKKGRLFLQVAEKKVKSGNTFIIECFADGKGEIIDGVEFIINFDPNLIEIKEIIEGEFFSLYPQKLVDKDKGQIKVIALQKTEEEKKLSWEKVVSFKAVALKEGVVDFNFVLEKSHFAAYGGQDLLAEAVSLTIEIN